MNQRGGGNGIIGLLIGLIGISVVVSLLFSPVFWVVAGGLCVYSAYKRRKIARQYQKYMEEARRQAESYAASQESYGERDGAGFYERPEPSVLFDGEYTEGTNDAAVMEEVYESNAIDVSDFEVIPDGEPVRQTW